MPKSLLDRREVLAGVVGLGAAFVAHRAAAQSPKPTSPAPAGPAPGKATPPTAPAQGKAAAPAAPGHGNDAPPAPKLSPALRAIIDSTARCLEDGRFCLARCTDHLASGVPLMQHCQRAVMNMLSVVAAMADVVGFRNSDPKDMKSLASTCAAFCRACATACEPHAKHHVECKACMESCLACAKACDAFARSA